MQQEPAQRVLDNLTTAVLVFDQHLQLTYVNPAGEMLLAASRRQVTGVAAAALFTNPALVRDFEQSLAAGHPFTQRDVELSLSGDRHVAVDLAVSPLTEAHSPTGLLLEVSLAERHRRIAREETLLAQHQLTSTVLRGLAHEIKNPLGGLRGAAQLLERQLHEESLKEYTAVIISEADRLQKLLDRLQGPSGLPQKRAVNVHLVLERVRQLVQAEGAPALQFARDYDPSLPELHADPDQLIQAVLNIVRNAMQALEGRGRIALRTRAERQCTIGQHTFRLAARIDITDDGPGIPPALIGKIFYPMVTGHAQGAGLGLSIAQTLVNQHGGLIECTSHPGQTVFTILLPLEVSDA